MNTKRILTAIGGLSISVQAATHPVLPGESIQAAIDGAAAGDVIAIFGGTYAEDLTISEAVRLVEVEGEDVTIAGAVTWDTVGDAPPFQGFKVGASGKGITITATTGLILKDIDASAGSALIVNGASSAAVVGGTYNGITQNDGEVTASDVSLGGHFVSGDDADRTVAFRISISYPNYCAWRSKKAWLGYSSTPRFFFDGTGCQVVVVGSSIEAFAWFDGTAGVSNTHVGLRGTDNDYTIVNSEIGRVLYQHTSFSGFRGDNGIIVYSGNRAYLANNYIYGSLMAGSFGGGPSNRANAIYSLSADVVSVNNIVNGIYRNLSAPAGALVRYNCQSGVSSTVARGAVSEGTFSANPLIASLYDPTLQPGSPCFDAGVEDALFNDLDGTRNDIGPSGGAWFDPDGWTTDKPVVISFDLGPTKLLQGRDADVTLSNGLGIAQPAP